MIPDCALEGYNFRTLYYLADRIYPRYLFCLPSHPDPQSKNENSCGAHHSSANEAIERLFGVMFQQFRILYNRCRLQCVKEIRTVVKTCSILLNVIVDARSYEITMQFRRQLEEQDDLGLNQKEVMSSECRVKRAR